MVTRKCLICGEANYSSDTSKEYWICCNCGNKIPKLQEKLISKEGREDNEVD